MERNMTKPQTRVRLITSAILILGFGSAIAIYIFVDAPPANPLGELGDSKMYVHDMLLYGGKANLLGSEVAGWFGTLLHGRRLRVSGSVIHVALACAVLSICA